MAIPGTTALKASIKTSNPTKQTQFGLLLLLLFIGITWGATFSLAKIATSAGGHPFGINYWQTLIGTSFLLAVGLTTRRFSPVNAGQFPFYVTCGLLGTVIPGTLFYYAASRVSPGVLSITIATVPLLTFTAATLLGVEKLRAGRIMGVVFGIISIALLVLPKESLPDAAAIPWIFLVLISAACYAAENLVVALRKPVAVNPLTIAAGMHIAAAIIMTPLVLSTDTFVPLNWPFSNVEWALVSLSLFSVIAYSLFIFLIIRAGPVFASQTAYVVTISGVLWGIIVFKESHSLWLWASLAVMMAALFLVRPAGR